MNPRILALTDDLTPDDFQRLLIYLSDHNMKISPIEIKTWRKSVGKEVKRED